MEARSPEGADVHEPVLYLGSDAGGPFEVNANVLATGRTCVIGASGSGKSYAVGVICEELCKSQVPFAIVDTEGEHSGLKEKYEVVLVGDDADVRPSVVIYRPGTAGEPGPRHSPADPGCLGDRGAEGEGRGAPLEDIRGGREAKDALPHHSRGGGQVHPPERREGPHLRRDSQEGKEARNRADGLHPEAVAGRQEHPEPVRQPAHREAGHQERPAGRGPVLLRARASKAPDDTRSQEDFLPWAVSRRLPDWSPSGRRTRTTEGALRSSGPASSSHSAPR